MTLRISSVSGKGGAGKTTAVILTAGELALKNRRVLLIDADPRQNLAEWWKRCVAKDNVPASISLATALRQNNIEKLMASQEANYDAILIDAPGVDSVVMDTIIDHSDIVITPIQPAQMRLKQLVKQRRQLRRERTFLTVVSLKQFCERASLSSIGISKNTGSFALSSKI